MKTPDAAPSDAPKSYDDYLAEGLALSGLTTKDLDWIGARVQGTVNLNNIYAERASRAEPETGFVESVRNWAMDGAEVQVYTPTERSFGEAALAGAEATMHSEVTEALAEAAMHDIYVQADEEMVHA